MAVVVCVTVWAGSSLLAVGFAVVGALVAWGIERSFVLAAVCIALAAAGAVLSNGAWHDAQPRRLGPYTGWAEVVGDPAPFGTSVRVTLEIDGERFDAWVYGSPRRRLSPRQAGDQVYISGVRAATTQHPRRAQVRHVVGRFTVAFVGDVLAGSPLDRASARIRGALRATAEQSMAAPDAALFSGLVIGDDARQPPTMTDAFRSSGLSHLTAVSGQNLALLLAAAAPVLRRLRPMPRCFVSIGLIAWFMALTRFEPSVLRAGVMAMLAVSGFVLGRRQAPIRLLSIAVVVLVLVDPLLVWSVGFWLSVGATMGVCLVGPWLAERLPGPRWLAVALGVTLGAQVGVVVPSFLVFHRLPLVSIPANLLAVPVAGAVMLYGLPAGLLAAPLPAAVSAVLMWPAAVGTHWVSVVAALGARVEPSAGWSWGGWVIIVAAISVAVRRGPRPSGIGESPP
ncbi:MAG: ComEC/Rec2 family competence protein [Ilumatobacteraceae bacterium]